MVAKAFKVYGIDGHRQKMSFSESMYFAIPRERKVYVFNSDLTGTNEYSIVFILRKTESEIYDELFGQISDGFFENCRVGKIAEMYNGKEVELNGNLIEQ